MKNLDSEKDNEPLLSSSLFMTGVFHLKVICIIKLCSCQTDDQKNTFPRFHIK